MKALLHIDESQKWSLLVANCKNLLDYIEKHNLSVDMVVVANSLAVSSLDKTKESNRKMQSRLEDLLRDSIRIFACENAMRNQGIEHDNLIAGVEVVEAGIAQILHLQEEGYAYIKP